MNIKKVLKYYYDEGFFKTIQKSAVKFYRIIIPVKTIIYYLDFVKLNTNEFNLPEGYELVRINDINQISDIHMQKIQNYIGNKYLINQLKSRLNLKGTILWFYIINKELVGFVWTIQGNYVAPYYIPILENDVVLFDVDVFPEYRGKGINPIFTNYILKKLKEIEIVRAFVTVAIWNKSSIRTLEKTDFKKFAVVRKLYTFGINITFWYKILWREKK